MKRIITLLLTIFIIVGQMNVIAAEENEDLKYEILHGLEILNEKKSGNIKYNDFFTAVLRALYDGEVTTENYQTVSETMGLAKFADGSGYITVDKACEIMLAVLGYGSVVADGNYYAEATELGLIKNSSVVAGTTLSYDNAVVLLYNMINTEVLETLLSPKLTLTKSDETLLEATKDIHIIKGIVKDNSLTSLSGKSKINDGEAQIGDYLLIDEKNLAADMLGMNVQAYVRYDESNDEYRLLYLYDKKNNTITLSDEEIEDVSDDFRTFSYVLNDRTKNLKLSSVLKVIYNGQFYGGYTKADLMPEVGEVKLIDNDTDGTYDVAVVTSYEIIVVDRISYVSSVVYNKYTHTGAASSIDLNNDHDDFDLKIFKDGVECGIKEIVAGDILNIAETKDRDGGQIIVYVTSSASEITVKAMDLNDKVITTDTGEHALNESFIREYIAGGKAAKGITVGNTYKAYFDLNGSIAALISETDEYQYFLLVRAYTDEFDEEIFLKGKNMKDEVVEYTLRRKVKYNANSVNKEVCYADLIDATGKTVVQVLQIKERNGIVREIRTAENTTAVNEEKFTKTDKSGIFRTTVNTFGNTVYVAGATVIVPPLSNTRDVNEYIVTNIAALRQDNTYSFTAYNLDEYGYTDLIMMNLTEAQYRKMFEAATVYVHHVGEVWKDDEVVQVLEGFVPGYGVLPIYSSENGIFDGIVAGDRVRLSINDNGRVFYASKEFAINNMGGTSNVTDIYTTDKNIYGTVKKLDVDRKHILLNCDGINSLSLTDTSVIIYHKDSKLFEKATIADIEIEEYVFCTTSWGKVTSVYVVRAD